MNLRYDLLLSPLVILCTLLLVVVPLFIQYINQYLHKHGDPPWKQSMEKNDEESNRSRDTI